MDIEPRAARSEWKFFGMAAAIIVPALLVRFDVMHQSVPVETLFFGAAILGSAFLLSWAAEVAQLDISQALAIAFLAFIAVLPEYAVDLVFAWKAGKQDKLIGLFGSLGSGGTCAGERCRSLAVANMTGANRLLIGVGWAAVVLLWWKLSGEKEVTLTEHRRTELGYLLVASVWAFSIPLRGSISFVDLVVLGAVFVAYVWRAATEEAEEPELVGPPLALAALPVRTRRIVTIGIFIFAAAAILASADPFANGLVLTGARFGINRFLLVQWLAPLASEAPEMIIAILFVLRMKPGAGLGMLVSSKVNQWSLLIASIPLVYAIAHGSASGMHLDARQAEEITLTAAQSLFAIAVLANMSINRAEAGTLLVLFLAQFGFVSAPARYTFAALYVALALGIMAGRAENRRGIALAARAAFTLPRKGG